MFAHQKSHVSITSVFNKFCVFLNATHVAVIFALLFFTSIAQAGQVNLAWDPNTQSTLGGYKLYYGTASGNYSSNVDVGNKTAYTVANLQDGAKYYFAVKAYDTTKTVESGFSNEVSTTILVAAPTADFSASPTTGTAPLTVSFTNLSSGSVTAWAWTFGDGGTSTDASPSHTYTTAGTYTVKLTVTNSTGSNTKTQSGSSTSTGGTTTTGGESTSSGPTNGGSTTAAFQQNSVAPNLLVMEAEHFTGNTAQGGYTWQATTSYGNYSGASALRALPEDNTRIDTNYAATSPRLDYQVNFVKTGTHYVWVRALGPSWSSDSLHVGLDGQEVASAARLSQLNPLGSWVWSKTTQGGTIATLNVTSTGLHTINVWMRESGTLLDKLVLTPDANYTPSDLGPDETINLESLSSPANPSTGLVAAYSFEEGSGSTTADVSGQGNPGVISGASWSARGKFGNALYFNGANSWVTINDSPSLDLTNSMTLEAWVYPTSAMSGWRAVINKEQPGGFGAAYYLAANSDLNQPELAVYTTDWHKLYGGPSLNANQWIHLAGTYDGTTLRLYVNGNQVSSQPQTGGIDVTNGVLRIGGNSYWGEFFQGRIDEVRIYNRALSASEIQSDMNTAQ